MVERLTGPFPRHVGDKHPRPDGRGIKHEWGRIWDSVVFEIEFSGGCVDVLEGVVWGCCCGGELVRQTPHNRALSVKGPVATDKGN